ncbi:Metallo-dependent phosphatase-like protein [Xylaria telfairii]|nr:Metallo-dependent phosphatase-like protein [Xylaria telfairii]
MRDIFNRLPFAAIISERIFVVHAGLSQDLDSMERLGGLMRPTHVPLDGWFSEFLWSNPSEDIIGWAKNDRDRRDSLIYIGPDVVSNFLKQHDLDLICRAHEMVKGGYELFAEKQLVTIYSVPRYHPESDPGAGAVMHVDESLSYSVQKFRPIGPQLEISKDSPGQGFAEWVESVTSKL